jgi:exosortase E/protease (VPEID-CTERM system)
MLVVSVLFDFTSGVAPHHNPVYYVTRLARWAAIAVPMFLMLTWAERRALAAQWTALENRQLVGRALWINLALFGLTAAASAAFTAHAASAASPPWHLLPFLGVLLAALAASLIAIVMPWRGLGIMLQTWRSQASIAGGVAFGVVLLADASLYLWEAMAEATLVLAAAILRLYESNVLVDSVERGIRVGDFGVLIWDSCSGFEGIALITGFVTVYLWAFRKELSFPKALLLYPIGLTASWLMNGVRIAALVSIGAHVSPDMAVRGFHSQAGWIGFLLVALGLMVLSRRLGLGAARPTSASPTAPAKAGPSTDRYDATVSHLLPFVAMMVGSIAMSVTAPHDRPVYVLKAGLILGALWICRRTYDTWRGAMPVTAASAGLLVGVAWIATAPSTEGGQHLEVWLIEIGPILAIAWLFVRGLGTIVLVPVAEELAFRGYLYRRLIRRDFQHVAPTAISWIALVVSSALFGVLHDRWLAGALAGVIFGLVMIRSGRIGDAIIAHGTANALIFAWALAVRDWSLL